ncbi:hypothetical protein JQ625_14980 [Bradyrhizobium diazoefficiens]|nr:hypothetical protein [Bradyrhizobium diazoefficiens]MBR0776140.1 hypothetical protein [Bradyrhizobium diazoefficiens]
MGNRSARFISTLIASVIAGAPFAAVSQDAPGSASAANAGSDCLASPKGSAPQGQHWYYRVERGTKRQCWYLRAEAKDGAKTEQTAQAAPETPAAAAPQPRSVQDARAEYLGPPSPAAPAPSPAQAAAAVPAPQTASPAADDNARQPAVASRWPDVAMAAAAPAQQPAPATSETRPSAQATASPAPVALTAAVADKPAGSLQMLLLVVGAALALAGLIASVIYRFAGTRMRLQAADRRSVNWDSREPQHHDDSRAPWIDMARAAASRAPQPAPIDFDALRPQSAQRARAAFDNAVGAIAARASAGHIAAAKVETKPIEDIETAEIAATDVEAAEPDEAGIDTFYGEFEIETSAPEVAANDGHDDAGVEIAEADEVDVDVITAMLERLAQQGPQLTQPAISRADFATPAQSPQDRLGVRA